MKKTIFLVITAAFLSGGFGQIAVINAQTMETDKQQKLDRDKSIPKEKVKKAFEEAKKIKESIVAVIEKKKPKFKLSASYADHLMYNLPGERGTTQNELTFLALNTNLFITVNLGLKKETALVSFRNGLRSITMANVYEISEMKPV
jgi:leucyl-tRNA synthetase